MSAGSEYLTQHLTWVSRALRDGVDVRGYFYWSLMELPPPPPPSATASARALPALPPLPALSPAERREHEDAAWKALGGLPK